MLSPLLWFYIILNTIYKDPLSRVFSQLLVTNLFFFFHTFVFFPFVARPIYSDLDVAPSTCLSICFSSSFPPLIYAYLSREQEPASASQNVLLRGKLLFPSKLIRYNILLFFDMRMLSIQYTSNNNIRPVFIISRSNMRIIFSCEVKAWKRNRKYFPL